MIKTSNEELNKVIGGGFQYYSLNLLYSDDVNLSLMGILVGLAKYAHFQGYKVSFAFSGSCSHNYELPDGIRVFNSFSEIEELCYRSDIVFVQNYIFMGHYLEEWRFCSRHYALPFVLSCTPGYHPVSDHLPDLSLRVFRDSIDTHIEVTRNNYGYRGGVYNLGITKDCKDQDDHSGMIYNEYNDTWSFGII